MKFLESMSILAKLFLPIILIIFIVALIILILKICRRVDEMEDVIDNVNSILETTNHELKELDDSIKVLNNVTGTVDVVRATASSSTKTLLKTIRRGTNEAKKCFKTFCENINKK